MSAKLPPEDALLTRDAFRASVFARDGHACVLCKAPGQDAHHIMERRLFPDGGYYLGNGATVCGSDHLRCEATLVSVEDVRLAAGIRKKILPPGYYDDHVYDKWGNSVLPNGQRMKGELFDDESVRKALSPVLHLFTDLVKYPRTFHAPWSPGMNEDDRVLASLDGFYHPDGSPEDVVVTVKMDGENTSMYRNYIHARSVDGRSHPSRDWVKNFHRSFAHDIPEGWRVCGENLYAVHSIKYQDLPSWFLGFSIWNERNICLGWDETLEWFDLFGITPVPVLYRGPFDPKILQSLYVEARDWDLVEGNVTRVTRPFHYSEFPKVVCKYVRRAHNRTVKHWMFGGVTDINGIKS